LPGGSSELARAVQVLAHLAEPTGELRRSRRLELGPERPLVVGGEGGTDLSGLPLAGRRLPSEGEAADAPAEEDGDQRRGDRAPARARGEDRADDGPITPFDAVSAPATKRGDGSRLRKSSRSRTISE
jgi:hypothetical protein